jgi:hypothetical protein
VVVSGVVAQLGYGLAGSSRARICDAGGPAIVTVMVWARTTNSATPTESAKRAWSLR